MAVEKPTGYLVYPSVRKDQHAVYLNPNQMDRAAEIDRLGKRDASVKLPDLTTVVRVQALYRMNK